MTLPPEPELQRAIAGDDLALAQLMRAHHEPLLRHGRRVCADPTDAADAVQEAFVKLARRHDLPREAGAVAWLFRVVTNHCLRFLRRAHVLRERLRRAAQPLPTEPSPEQLLSRYRLGQLLQAALAELPPLYRQVLELRDVEGLTGEQVCAALELSEPAMKSRLHRARTSLRAALLRSMPDAEGRS